jgi:hypothetical protein
MYRPLLAPYPNFVLSTKGAGPIIIALAFMLALGSATAAAVAICGWHNVYSVSVSFWDGQVEILCR